MTTFQACRKPHQTSKHQIVRIIRQSLADLFSFACALRACLVLLLGCSLPLAHRHNVAHNSNDEAAQLPHDNKETPMMLSEHDITSFVMVSAELLSIHNPAVLAALGPVEESILSNRISQGETGRRSSAACTVSRCSRSAVSARRPATRAGSSRSAPTARQSVQKAGRPDAAPHVLTTLGTELPASGLEIELCTYCVHSRNHNRFVLMGVWSTAKPQAQVRHVSL